MMPYRIQQVASTLHRASATLRGMAHVDTHDLAGTVLLAGSGRSGTTWLGQFINADNTYRDVFEPFHGGRVRAVQGWPVLRYMPPQAGNATDHAVIKQLLAGQVRSPWTDAYNRKTFVRRRLVKAIRANLLLGWVRRHCPQVRLLFAMRHPCAVAHSRLRLGWDTHLDELLSQPDLMRDHLGAFRETIERTASDGDAWSRHLTMWCIENVVPLRQLKPGDMHVLFYERFCDAFDDEAAVLFGFLGRKLPKRIERARSQRSAHFRRDSAILRGGDLVDAWRQHVTTRQLDRALALLAVFGLDHVYDERALPGCDRNNVFIDSNPPVTPAALPAIAKRDAA